MELKQDVNAPKKPFITINAVGRVIGDLYEFGGYMSINGQAIGPVTGVFSGNFLAAPKRRKGRPKNEPLKVAIALHEHMAMSSSHGIGESKRLARIRAARALSIGGDDDNAEKYIRTHSKHETVEAVLSDYDRVMTWDGDAKGEGRLALILRQDASVRVVDSALHIRGMAWCCQWGERRADCGCVDFVVTTDSPHLLAAAPSWFAGGA